MNGDQKQNCDLVMEIDAGGLVQVTGLTFLDDRLVMLGSGENVSVMDIKTGMMVQSQRVLYGCSVFGFAKLQGQEDQVVVFGEKQAKLCRLERFGDGDVALELVFDFGSLFDLVWDVHWIDGDHIAFGFAQGYVEIWKRGNVNDKFELHTRVLSQARCILYSLCFMPKLSSVDGEVWLASGTVFGDLILWDCNPAKKGAISHRCKGHRGPIFRVKWSFDAQHICTVGDDRTVRMWSRENDWNQKWCSYGHGARIWDCTFARDNSLVITVGEDTDTRIWDGADGQILAIVDAHFSRNVWRCAVSPNQAIICTGGADTCLKMWDIERELDSRKHFQSLLTYHADASEEESKSPGPTMSYCTCLEGTAGLVVVASSDGHLFRLKNCMSRDRPVEWKSIFHIGDLKWKALSSIGSNLIFAGLSDGSGIVMKLSENGDEVAAHTKLNVHEQRQVTFTKLLPLDDTCCLGVAAGCDSPLLIWKIEMENVGVEFIGTQTPPALYQLRSPSCMCLVLNRFLVYGERRGHIYITDLENLDQPSNTMANQHGTLGVSNVSQRDGFLYSSGHNACVVKYRYEVVDDELKLDMVYEWKLGATFSLIEYMGWTKRGSLYVGGFMYNDFIVWDVEERYLLLRDRCNGWKRPGTMLVDPENDLFRFCGMIYADSVRERKQRKAPIHDICIHRTVRATNHEILSTVGQNFHSRSIWTVRWVPNQQGKFLVTCCEDGLINLLTVDNTATIDRGDGKKHAYLDMMKWEQQSLPTNNLDLKVVAQASRRGEGVRTSCFSSDSKENVFITGGARELIRCWAVNTKRNEIILLAETSNKAGDEDNTQRILGVNARCLDCNIGTFGRHIVVAATSMGELIIYSLDPSDVNGGVSSSSKKDFKASARFELPYTFNLIKVLKPNDFKEQRPIRSLDCVWTENTSLAVIGRTNGFVEVWDIDKGEQHIKLPQHQMGVNCLHVHQLSPEEVFVASGGDDQALSVLHYNLVRHEVTFHHTLPNAAGSAIRGLAISNAQKLIWINGLHQRLRAFDFTLQSIQWDMVLEIPDVNAIDLIQQSNTQNTIAIVGNGLRIISFNN